MRYSTDPAEIGTLHKYSVSSLWFLDLFPAASGIEVRKARLLLGGVFVAWTQWRTNSLRGYVKEWFPGPIMRYRLGTKEEREGDS